MIVRVFVMTLSDPCVSRRTPFTEALLCTKSLVYVDLMAQYWYQTEAMIKSIEKYLKGFLYHNEVLS